MNIKFDEMFKFKKELYSKTALLKAAYNFSDSSYIHLDADEEYYYVSISPKTDKQILLEKDFINEMLAQSIRHEVYRQTKNIRELMLARAMASSVMVENDYETLEEQELFSEDEILNNYLVWYNELRIKKSLGYMSPMEYRRSLRLVA